MADLAAGPAAWVTQLVVGYGVAGYACYRRDAPLQAAATSGWGAERFGLLALNLACLLVTLIALTTSYIHWRRTRGETGGGAGRALEVGEGRSRFLAACGILINLAFCIAILFDTAPILGVPTCWSIAP